MYAEGLDDSSTTGDDKRLHVVFHLHPQKNDAKSTEAGRPIFEETEYVRITVPGDKHNIVDRPAREDDRQRFPRQYAHFKSGAAGGVVGTPLSEWPAVTRSQVEELAFFHVKTVEQLANLSDGNAQHVGPILALREKARDWLAKAAGGAVESKLRAEIQERESKLAAMQAQIDALIADKKTAGKGKTA
jgi:hypothetical protein